MRSIIRYEMYPKSVLDDEVSTLLFDTSGYILQLENVENKWHPKSYKRIFHTTSHIHSHKLIKYYIYNLKHSTI